MTDKPLSEGEQKLYDKISKLLQLASKNSNAEEAASAAAKAQELIVQYNLDVSILEQSQDRVDGRREEAKVSGGFYKFQRELYRAVAELNFCMYFTEEYYIERTKTTRREDGNGRVRAYYAGSKKRKHRHCVIGKQINTATTKIMGAYLLEAIERITRDRLRKSDGVLDNKQLLSAWATSFREGAAQNIMDRITEQQGIEDRKRKAAAVKADRAAKAAGHSSATMLTISDVKRTEEAANYDFMYGEGAWDRAEKYAKEAAAERKAVREKMARLAKENPEEFARLEKENNKRRRRSYGRSAPERPKDWSAYNDGHTAGAGISLHQQTGTASAGKLGAR